MGYFAELDEHGVVQQVIAISNTVLREPGVSFPETEAFGQDYIRASMGFPGKWVQCSFNASFRKQYPGKGFVFDEDADVFVAPQPYPSWTLDAQHDWQPPVPSPGSGYEWDEDSLSWVPVP